MRVCYFGTYRADYSRNQIMINGLRDAGVEVIECHERLWHGIEDRVRAGSGGWLRPKFIGRVIKVYCILIKKYLTLNDFDILIVGYPGQFDVLIAYVLSRLRKKPIVWDIFMSIYLIAVERGLDRVNPITVQLLWWIEKIACHLPDLLVIDTVDYSQWFSETYRINSSRFSLVPTGANEQVFYPTILENVPSENVLVSYHGSFIPNHGVTYIVEAARILQNYPQIKFEMIGIGPEYEIVQELITRYELINISLIGWLSQPELVDRLRQSDLILGAFGTTPQSLLTVQNKIYEGLALSKPVLTGDSPTIRRQFVHLKHLYLVQRADPQAIADGIIYLKSNPSLRRQLSENGYSIYCKQYTIREIGHQYAQHLVNQISRSDHSS